jgi:hypothetical protein
MRGPKSGLEVRIREKQQHLLDIDGDLCHHVHNACKAFCKPFEYHVEGLFNDLHNDFMWSSDLKAALQEICLLMNIKFTMPERFVGHRWLSAYDCSCSTSRMFDAFEVFYLAFMDKDDKELFREVVAKTLRKHGVSGPSMTRIKAIWEQLKKKVSTLTEDGKNRKKRIVEKVLIKAKKTKITMSFYQAALLMLKEMVMIFQKKAPLIHRLYDEMERLIREFCGCFFKPEMLNACTLDKLKSTSLEEQDMLPVKAMFFGDKN